MSIGWVIAGIAILVLAGVWAYGQRVVRRRAAHGETCPRCGQSKLHRIHRTLPDHLFGLGLRVRRYRCLNPDCRWEGLRRRANL